MKKYILLAVLLLSNFCWASSGSIMKPRLGYQINTAHPLAPLPGLWLFNEGSGNIVQDLSGNGNTGTLIDDTHWVPGKFGSALDFDGTGDYVQTLSNELKTAENFTISLWFKADSTDYAKTLLWQGDVAGNLFGTEAEMHLNFGMYDGSGNNDYLNFVICATQDTQWAGTINIFTAFSDTISWHHVLVVVKNMSSSPAAEMFLDGVSVGSDTGTTELTDRTNWDTNLRFGRPGADTRYFDGLIDHAMIYSHALNASEIALLYREPFCFMQPSWNWVLYGSISVPTAGGQVIIIN